MPIARIEKTIQFIDVNGEQLAEFLMLTNDDLSQKWVKCIPYFGMYEVYRQGMNNPIVVMAGMMMPDTSFLGYIANIIRTTKDTNWCYVMRSHDPYISLTLTQGMNAKDITKLTGYDLQMVKDFYRDFFVVSVDRD